jgi:YbgC/YbaW family acyl-CoA thioester hydrolase
MFEYRRKIFGFECDIYGHLNNANYQHLLEEARSDALDKMDCSLEKLNAEKIHIYLKRVEIDYLKGVPFGIEVVVKTEIIELSRIKSVWKQKIFNANGELFTRAELTGVFAREGKPYRISDSSLAKLRIYL